MTRFNPEVAYYASIAQWIERFATDEEVGGSNPSWGAEDRTGPANRSGSIRSGHCEPHPERTNPPVFYGSVAEWSKAQLC